MKKFKAILFSTIFLIFSFASSKAELLEGKVEYFPVLSNFNGSAYNGKVILVYGDAGIIVKSVDGGKNWKQIVINDSFSIIGMVSIGKNFYGITSKKYMIFSNDDGETWTTKELGNSIQFYKILAKDTILFCLTDSKIILLDGNLNIKKEYDYSTDTASYDMTILNNIIAYSAGKGKLGLIDISNDNSRILNFSDYGICSSCPAPSVLMSDDSNIYFYLQTSGLYRYKIQNDSIEFILNPESNILTNYGNQIYLLYSFSLYDRVIDSLRFYRIDVTNKQAIRIYSKFDRYIKGTKIKNFMLISEDTIIAVGKDKLILMSYDDGKNFEVVSFCKILSSIPVFIFDRLNAKIANPMLLWISTTDGGVTWKPPKNWNEMFIEIDGFYDPANYGGTAYFKDKMHGMAYGENSFGETPYNLAYTNDGGDSIALKYEKMIYGGSSYSLITDISNNFVATTNYYILNKNYIIINSFSDSMELTGRTVFADSSFFWIQNINDTLYAFGRDFKDTNKFFIAFSIDTGKVWQNVYSFKLEGDFERISNISYRDGNLFISYLIPTSDTTGKMILLCYNFSKRTLLKILEKDATEFSGINAIVKIMDTYYIVYYYFGTTFGLGLLANKNFEADPTNWEKLSFVGERYSITNIVSSKGDSLYAISAYDSLLKRQTLFFAKEKQTSPVIETPTIEESPSLYISRPIPNPARNSTTMRIYYDSRFDIERADFRAYNMMGMQVAGKEAFTLTRLNYYSSDLSWNFAGLPSGVYLVVVRLGGETRSAAVVVE